ncbi:MAG: YihY family inner membrane protein [Pseudomonadales bacterium]|nr:YihY family inner membrane protein [Pseudomonadales bacterium]
MIMQRKTEPGDDIATVASPLRHQLSLAKGRFELSSPLVQGLRNIWAFCEYLRRGFYGDRCHTVSAALTYQTLFAVVPVLTLVFSSLDYFEMGRDLRQTVELFIFSNIVPQNAIVVQEYLLSFSAQARSLGAASLAFVAVTAFIMLYTIEGTFNAIWRVKQPRHGLQRILMYWAVLSLAAPVIVVSIWITGYIESLPLISEVAETPRFLNLITILISGSMFTLVYAVVPNCDVPLRYAVVGGAIAALTFELAKLLFTAIMSQSSFEAIYGTFAAAPLFLLWIYIMWMIILMGAEVVKSLGVYRFKGSGMLEAPLFQIVCLLEIFYQAHQQGEVVKEEDIRKHGARIDLENWTEYRSMMIERKLIRIVDRGGMVLSKDLNQVSIWDLYTALPWQLPQWVKGDKDWEKKLSECFAVLYKTNRAVLQDDLEQLFKRN